MDGNVAEDVATVDNTGKLTLKKPADSLTVTVTGKKDGKVIMSDSATFNVVYAYDMKIDQKSLDWADLTVGATAGANRTYTFTKTAESELVRFEWEIDGEGASITNAGVATFAQSAIGTEIAVTCKGYIEGNIEPS